MAVGLLGCAKDVPLTTEADRNVLELRLEWNVGPADWRDLLLVIDPSERAAATTSVLEMARILVTGDLDADDVADIRATSIVRIAVVSPEELDAIDRCGGDACTPEPKVASYHWQPYGFAPPVSAFLDDLRCLLSENTDTCVSNDEPGATRWAYSAFEPELHTRLQLADVERIAEQHDLSVLSAGPHCNWDYVSWDTDVQRSLDRLAFDQDGQPECEMHETLPEAGAITECKQLAGYGRTFDHVASDGREVCTIEQHTLTDSGAMPAGHGFYFDPEGRTATRFGSLPLASATPQFFCGWVSDEMRARFLMTEGTPVIPQSTITLRCMLSAAE